MQEMDVEGFYYPMSADGKSFLYDEIRNDNDIVVIKLKNDIKFENGVAPACLPTKDYKPVNGEYCTVSGWGKTAAG